MIFILGNLVSFSVLMYWYKKNEIFCILLPSIINSKSKVYVRGIKAIIYELWEAGKTQNEIAVQVGCIQSAILKIRLTCSKQSNCRRTSAE